MPKPAEETRVQQVERLLGERTKSMEELLVVMQAVLIEWKHGRGADAALQWVVNTLAGPGLLPDADAPYGREAQMWFNEHSPNNLCPRCACGRPSHIGWMGQGFCCEEHYAAAKAKTLN